MEKIASFTIDHLRLLPGIYVSRRDRKGGIAVTTFDLRFVSPNREPVMDMPAVHTIEHLGATYLRSCPLKEDVVYFGPMGCRTGFYLLMFGEKQPEEIYPTVLEMCDFIAAFEGGIPGAEPDECGNYLEHNPATAAYYAARYAAALRDRANFRYPD